MHPDIATYNRGLDETDRVICDQLATILDRELPGGEGRIWHAYPVWFIEGNPIVGYSKLKDSVRLLFWSGQSFEEEKLSPEGKFRAAEIRYRREEDIQPADLKRWLKKSAEIQWDYKNIVKRKGRLERLK